mmetsp:Transcript_5459/g.13322  ORF Transcript_5459/g.13322 Transcript_5459/m.13322 type:complete len:300 (+) Transcript_5459:19-918(+)
MLLLTIVAITLTKIRKHPALQFSYADRNPPDLRRGRPSPPEREAAWRSGGEDPALESQPQVLPVLVIVERLVVLLLVVHVELREDVLHHPPVERRLRHVLSPVLAQRLGGRAEVVPRDLSAHVVRHVPVDVVAEPFDPPREVAVDRARELSLGSVPLLRGLEGDVGRGVVDDGEGAHPEVIPEPRHEPELDPPGDARVVDEGRPCNGHEAKHRRQADHHPRLLLLVVLVDVEVPDEPMADRRKALEGRAEDKLVQDRLDPRPALHLALHHRVPRRVLHELVRVGVVVVVLDPPRLKRVD